MTSGGGTTPDFDKLAAGNNDFAPPADGVQDNHGRGGIVVDHRGRLGPGQATKQVLNPGVTPRSLARGHIHLKERVAGQFLLI